MSTATEHALNRKLHLDEAYRALLQSMLCSADNLSASVATMSATEHHLLAFGGACLNVLILLFMHAGFPAALARGRLGCVSGKQKNVYRMPWRRGHVWPLVKPTRKSVAGAAAAIVT